MKPGLTRRLYKRLNRCTEMVAGYAARASATKHQNRREYFEMRSLGWATAAARLAAVLNGGRPCTTKD